MAENETSAVSASEDDEANKSITSPRSDESLIEINNLEERFSQQQVMISQLKEMVLAEEMARTEKIANTRLKVEKYASQLAKIRNRAKQKKSVSTTSKDDTPKGTRLEETPKRISAETSESVPVSQSTPSPSSSGVGEKPKLPSRGVTKLLHQQIQERKAMIAEQTKNEKELEKAILKIQKKLEECQNQSPEVTQVQSKPVSTIPVVLHENIENDKIITELRLKINLLEGTILDLQETCKEKDNVIRSKTEAITLMSANLSKKGKDTLDLLDDTKEQMQKMQENFANMESNMKMEKQALLAEMEVFRNKINNLEEANSILESERFKLSIENAQLEEKIVEKDTEIERVNAKLHEKIKEFEDISLKLNEVPKAEDEEEKGMTEIKEMNALTEKIEILEKLNNTLRQSNIELEEKLKTNSSVLEETLNVGQKSRNSPSKPKSRNSKGKEQQKSRINEADIKSYLDDIKKLEHAIEILNKQILEKEISLTQKDNEISKLQESLDSQKLSSSVKESITSSSQTASTLESVEIIQDPNDLSLRDQLEDALKQIEKLNKELSESNKNMIKLKANHKTKVKQMQKSIDDFSKVSDSNAEVIRLQSEINTLTQKVAELEDDKGNLQLHLVDYDSGRVSESQLHSKLAEIETVAEERLKAIADLEMQKFDLVQELHLEKQKVTELEDKMADLTMLENEHVSSEIKYAQLEEQMDVLKSEKNDILSRMENLTSEKDSLLANIEILTKEKIEVNNKLEYYIQENMELIDRLEKLSAEKVSSAESIEMVESLTSQEKLEIEQYQKAFNISHNEKDMEIKEDDSFSKTEVDKTNLIGKIDIYSQENQDYVEKLENLQASNNEMSIKLEELLNDKSLLKTQLDNIIEEKEKVYDELKDNEEKISQLSKKIDELSVENNCLSEKLKQLSTTSPARTEEVVVSETIEVEDTIEKEFIELPTKSITTAEPEPLKIVESEEKPKDVSKSSSKSDKKSTKEILRLKSTIKNKESEIANLTAKLDEISEIKKLNEGLNDANILLNSKLEGILSNNSTLNEEILILKNEKFKFDSTILDMQQNYQTMLQSLENEISVNKNNIAELDKTIENKDKEIQDMRNKISQDKSLESKNKTLFLDLENKILHLRSIIEKNDREISTLESDLYDSFDDSDKFYHMLNYLQKEMDIIINILDNKQIEINTLLQERNNTIEKLTELEKECLNKNMLIENFKEQLSESNSSCVDHVNSLSSYEITVAELNEKCLSYELNEKVLNENLISVEDKYKSQCAEIEEIKNNLMNKTNLCCELEDKINDLTNKLLCESKKYDDIESNMRALQCEFSVLQDNLNRTESELSQARSSESKLLDIENQLSQSQINYQNLMDDFNKCSQNNQELTNQNNVLQSKISDYELQYEALQREHSSYTENITMLKNEIKSSGDAFLKIQQLEEKLAEEQGKVEKLIKELDELHITYNESCSAHNAKIQEREVYIESLEIELNKYKEKIVRLEENLLNMEAFEKKSNNLISKLQEKDLMLSETLQREDGLNKKIAALTNQNKSVQKQLQELKRENNTLQGKIEEINNSKKHLQSDLDCSHSELSNLKNYISDLEIANQDRSTLVEKCSALETQLKNMSHDYSDQIKSKIEECENLEKAYQVQSENFDSQLRQVREHCKDLQDEVSMHLDTIHNMKLENDHLKNEMEHLSTEKNRSDAAYSLPFFKFDDSNFNQSQSSTNQEISHLQVKISNLTSLLNEKDAEIKKLQQEIASFSVLKQSAVSEEIVKKVSHQEQNASKLPVQSQVYEVLDLEALQNQIISDDDIQKKNISSEETPMIRSFCHDPPVPVTQTENLLKSDDPTVIDEQIKPKVAFKCFTGFEDDSIQELRDMIDTLKTEKEKLASDLAQSQIKSNKALLKLKEYKLKYDSVNAEIKKLKSASNASDLDTAIQDELTSQITSLENKLKELTAIFEKEKLEKDNLSKRVEVLTSANERLLEMKEKQDMEMEIYKVKNQSLNEKVKNLQWGDDFPMEDEHNSNLEDTSKSESYVKTINELNDKIKDLETDNENLQISLDEQKNKFELLIENERKSMLENTKCSDDFKHENFELRKLLEESSKEKSDLNILLETTVRELNLLRTELVKSTEIISLNNAAIDTYEAEKNDLKNKLQLLIEEYSEFQEKFKNLEMHKEQLKLELDNKMLSVDDIEKENKNINIELINMKNEISKISYEKQEYVEKYEELYKKHHDILLEKESLENNMKESIAKNSEFNTELRVIQEKLQLNEANAVKISNEKSLLEQRIYDLELQLREAITTSNNTSVSVQETCVKNVNDLTIALNDTRTQLQNITMEKDRRIQEIEAQLLAEAQKLEHLSKEHKALYDSLIEKENEVMAINNELFNLKNMLMQSQNTQTELQNIIESRNNDYRHLEETFKTKIEEYNAYNNAREIELTEKNNEIQYMRSNLEHYNHLVQQVAELEAKLGDVTHEKDAELANLRLKMHADGTSSDSAIKELTDKVGALEVQLQSKIEECKDLNAKLTELQTLVDEEATQMSEMRTALENQEIEIVTLKENLAAHADAYEKLNKAYKSGRHVTFAENTKYNDEPVASPSKQEQTSPRADLDLALYMLHQRDVRCEELTVELMQLLEERDTLQLKLSNSIRSYEELRARLETQKESPEKVTSQDTNIENPDNDPNNIVEPVKEDEGSSNVDAPSGASLENKISELRATNQMRDIRVKDERESRQRQMELLQRDIQNLPPEAAAQLREAHYTLSRDTQSASTVLFNWLWGRTTPKVVDM